MSAVHLEETLEFAIVQSLRSAATTAREQLATYEGVLPPDTGYRQREATHYDPTLCLDPELVFEFIILTQPKEWEKLRAVHGDEVKPKFLRRLAQEIERRGALDVLREGVKDHGCKFDLAYFAPASGLNPEHAQLYGSNLLSIARQLPIRPDAGETVDLGLFVNGILVATAELKHHMTGQNVQHAMKQYRLRNPRDTVFQYGRCVAHFAVDNDLVYVTTKVAGRDTRFLPFNKGNYGEAGNPPNPDGFRSAYLWEEIWRRDNWLDILGHFIHEQETEDIETGKKHRELIFPRFHQLDAVRRLLADAKEKGTGQRYLVQHSAGSGKSNTIAWLVHRLANLHDAASNRVFDSIIVVTDRRILDRQLRNTIKDFEKVAGLVVGVTEGSKQLKEALETGKQIIVTTIQKFPIICEEVGSLPGKRFAIVIDEAHSGQAGETQRAMSKTLQVKTLEDAEAQDSGGEDESVDDKILRELEKTGLLSNASYFAFTATPKQKTLEMFGVCGPDGKFVAFSLYTMKQAIREQFILDVLQNYTTYSTFFNLLKKVEEDPEYPKREAAAVMLRYVDMSEHGIRRKAEIMVDHFSKTVAHRIKGKAKAMVVTRSRLHAVRYKEAFDHILREKGLPYKALVAFSGEVIDHDTGIRYTEPSMNGGISEKQTAEVFNQPESKFLICAEKFQTGFDQPLLHTMYVDKKLVGLNAVQTLSRLNRTHPEKEECFVLDFANVADEIQKAFNPYYEATILSEATDPNKLYDLEREILAHEFFGRVEVEAFAEVFWSEKLRPEPKLQRIHAQMDPVVERYMDASEEQRGEFKSRVEQYVRLYSFLSQIMPFSDPDLEKQYQYCRLLRGKLPLTRKSLPTELLEQVGLDSYKIVPTGSHKISLSGDEELLPVAPLGVGTPTESEKELLSRIIQAINEAFGTDFDEGDKVMIGEVRRRILSDQGLRDAVLNNPKDAVRIIFEPLFEKVLNDLIDDNLDFYKKVMDNDGIRSELKSALFDAVYRDLIRYGE